MGAEAVVTLTLTRAQVVEVLRRVTPGAQCVFAQVLGVVVREGFIEEARAFEQSPRLSRSCVTGLVVLSVFARSGGPLGIQTLARRLGLHMSTTHRYVQTLVAVGFVVQHPETRQYMIATDDPQRVGG